MARTSLAGSSTFWLRLPLLCSASPPSKHSRDTTGAAAGQTAGSDDRPALGLNLGHDTDPTRCVRGETKHVRARNCVRNVSTAHRVEPESAYRVEAHSSELSAQHLCARLDQALHCPVWSMHGAGLDEGGRNSVSKNVIESNGRAPSQYKSNNGNNEMKCATVKAKKSSGGESDGQAASMTRIIFSFTLYRHFDHTGIETSRREFTEIDDGALAACLQGSRLECSLASRWEKLRLWGFYVHGCIDGHSRLIIYLACRANKLQATVAEFLAAVAKFSRGRGNFETENNEVERPLIAHWGVLHRAYLRGRSRHNVRIERLWRMCARTPSKPSARYSTISRKMGSSAWKTQFTHDKTPIAIYELSRTAAITRGYWTGDPGNDVQLVASDPLYGYDGEASLPLAEITQNEPLGRTEQPVGTHPSSLPARLGRR
ncbi:hypothetical protein B0H14DRAFT_3784634 [Mycena olivaceomarginata]|nr:hypothetical protein B0H14DRAFT_3784634 [Mycena olivaceomarginata]